MLIKQRDFGCLTLLEKSGTDKKKIQNKSLNLI